MAGSPGRPDRCERQIVRNNLRRRRQGLPHKGCGAVFSVDPDTGSERILYSFCSLKDCADGSYPSGSLIDFKGILYGTTEGGGARGNGTVFALDPASGAETVLHSFCTERKCADGAVPIAGLTALKGMLYGTTYVGGRRCGCGTVFSLDPGTGSETVLYSFCSANDCGDGEQPWSGLVAANGKLYGTASSGGRCTACGTLFSIGPDSGAETTLYYFCSENNCADGAAPVATLIDANGLLYGTTESGGRSGCAQYGCGTVFSLDPHTGVEKVLYSFCRRQGCPDGAAPEGGLTNVSGTLYGTTSYGDRPGCPQTGACATIFSIDPGRGAWKRVYTFCGRQNCADGADPASGLIAANGNLYGTTAQGGASGLGTVFALRK